MRYSSEALRTFAVVFEMSRRQADGVRRDAGEACRVAAVALRIVADLIDQQKKTAPAGGD